MQVFINRYVYRILPGFLHNLKEYSASLFLLSSVSYVLILHKNVFYLLYPCSNFKNKITTTILKKGAVLPLDDDSYFTNKLPQGIEPRLTPDLLFVLFIK